MNVSSFVKWFEEKYDKSDYPKNGSETKYYPIIRQCEKEPNYIFVTRTTIFGCYNEIKHYLIFDLNRGCPIFYFWDERCGPPGESFVDLPEDETILTSTIFIINNVFETNEEITLPASQEQYNNLTSCLLLCGVCMDVILLICEYTFGPQKSLPSVEVWERIKSGLYEYDHAD